jgi:hypothetical protein
VVLFCTTKYLAAFFRFYFIPSILAITPSVVPAIVIASPDLVVGRLVQDGWPCRWCLKTVI